MPLDRLAHGLLGIELRLLRQVADLDAGHGDGLALDLLVDAAMILSRVDLPEPLRPSTPILAPGKKLMETSFKICRLGARSW